MRLYYCVDPAGIVAFTRVALSTCRRPKSNFLSVFHPQPPEPVRHGSRSSPTTKSAKNGRRETWERTVHGTTNLGGWTTEDGWVRQARRIPVRKPCAYHGLSPPRLRASAGPQVLANR